jgi:hypothetical protein
VPSTAPSSQRSHWKVRASAQKKSPRGFDRQAVHPINLEPLFRKKVYNPGFGREKREPKRPASDLRAKDNRRKCGTRLRICPAWNRLISNQLSFDAGFCTASGLAEAGARRNSRREASFKGGAQIFHHGMRFELSNERHVPRIACFETVPFACGILPVRSSSGTLQKSAIRNRD